ncbi:MAG: 23S rRNA (adenine(2503)-C(2))-methyltransferase RlmN [Bacilli bacterium]
MKSIYGETLLSLENYFILNNDKKFRATQVYEWLYNQRVSSFNEMTNLKKEVIALLSRDFYFEKLSARKIEREKEVNKYLFELIDKEQIEAVLMRHDYGNSLCISTQVGCNMGCTFCESGRLKKVRNLTSSEMVSQILAVELDIKERVSHVVLMGIGEPFDNYQEVINFIEIINHNKGIALGSRHITVSTCGIIPKIIEFTKLPYQVNLAISLHAPNDSLRTELMPINKVYPLSDLMPVLKNYIDNTSRRLTFEYILLEGINDQEEHALALVKLLRGLNCYVNLIPYNETNHLKWKRSNKETILSFYDILKKNKIGVTIRREFGSNISAACGQLRSKKEE